MTEIVPHPFQAPGIWRRIEVHPFPGLISAGLEDDFHHFLLRLEHADGVITGAKARAERYPWSTCAEAGLFLAEQAVGRQLQDVARLDAYSHCTHLFELAILCAAHAADTEPTRFDLWVGDRKETRTHATLAENGHAVLNWDLDGTLIEAPEDWGGRDLKKLSVWRTELTPEMAERAMLLRRAIHISGGRNPSLDRPQRASDRGLTRMGACFTYQMPRAQNSFLSLDGQHDFTGSGDQPLKAFDPDWR